MLGGYYLGQLYLGISGLPAGGILSPQGSSHQLSSDNITLTQKHTIVVDSAAHTLASDNLTLTQKHLLAIDAALHTLMSENVALTSEHFLGVNDAFHSLVSTEIGLTQKHTIVVDDTTHDLTSGNLELVEHKTLVVQNTTHGHIADGDLPIVVQFYLLVDNASHNHTADNTVLTQWHLLAVANTLHSLESTTLGGLINLEPDGFGGGFGAIDGWAVKQYAEINILLPNNYLIVGLDSYIDLFDDFTDLTQKHVLDVHDGGISLMLETIELVEKVYRYSGTYIRDIPSDGAHGSEYEKSTGTIPRKSTEFGEVTTVPEPNLGFLIVKMGSSGSYDEDTVNNGIIKTDNMGSGYLTTEVIETGIYTKDNIKR